MVYGGYVARQRWHGVRIWVLRVFRLDRFLVRLLMAQQIEENQRTERMAGQRNTTGEGRIALTEQRVQSVQRIADRIDDALAEHRARVEQHVEQRVVSEVAQLGNRIECDRFQLLIHTRFLRVQIIVPRDRQYLDASDFTAIECRAVVALYQLCRDAPELIDHLLDPPEPQIARLTNTVHHKHKMIDLLRFIVINVELIDTSLHHARTIRCRRDR
uniref:Putative secreted protein n=1 Tax=Anopheles darlingi TaxID=43151 RepID=A0A2M4D9U8_ANODA